MIKFGGNVSDRCGNLTKKTELKSADSEHHLVVFQELFDQGSIDILAVAMILNKRIRRTRSRNVHCLATRSSL